MLPVIHALLLILIANGAPILARRLMGNTGACPLDTGRQFIDGEPLFGNQKTVRGLLAALVLTTAAAMLLGLPASIGLLVGGGSMCGDLLTSFIKRRLHIAPSGRAPVLDQVPESLLPAWLAADAIGLDTLDMLIVVVMFILLGQFLSRLLFALNVRKRPY